jgi:hypothetical protein
MQIGEILVKEGLLTKSQLEEALELQKKNPKKKIGEILIECDYIDIESFTKYLAQQLKDQGLTR